MAILAWVSYVFCETPGYSDRVYGTHKFFNLCFLTSTISNFFPECITASDCPAGGTNYVCNANKCDCPSPKVLDGDRCVGMLPFKKEKLPKYKM